MGFVAFETNFQKGIANTCPGSPRHEYAYAACGMTTLGSPCMIFKLGFFPSNRFRRPLSIVQIDRSDWVFLVPTLLARNSTIK